jgi:hypothetical protein
MTKGQQPFLHGSNGGVSGPRDEDDELLRELQAMQHNPWNV